MKKYKVPITFKSGIHRVVKAANSKKAKEKVQEAYKQHDNIIVHDPIEIKDEKVKPVSKKAKEINEH